MSSTPGLPTQQEVADIVKRLRYHAEIARGYCEGDPKCLDCITADLACEAADALEALALITPEALGKQLLAQGFGDSTKYLQKAFDALAPSVTVVPPQQQDTPQRFGMAAWSGNDEVRVAGNTLQQTLDALKEAAEQKWGTKQ